eukprot:5442731-Pyramimonas_sp.AAC.1
MWGNIGGGGVGGGVGKGGGGRGGARGRGARHRSEFGVRVFGGAARPAVGALALDPRDLNPSIARPR